MIDYCIFLRQGRHGAHVRAAYLHADAPPGPCESCLSGCPVPPFRRRYSRAVAVTVTCSCVYRQNTMAVLRSVRSHMAAHLMTRH